MTNVAITLTFFLVLCIGVILLQIFLSKKESKWFGLILPIISLCISFIAVFSIAAYTTTGTLSLQTLDESGAVVQEEVIETPDAMRSTQDTPSMIFTVVSVFLLYNIPTIILLAIYFACREKQRQRKALEKMQAQDLE